ncbi:YutD family protein [Streptococcaceae bacterium ESL0729]|nr:YutD family protein [Streptococcaceae bacterium ESL0729]
MDKKNIPEEMKNYNRFKGEAVISKGDDILIGDKVFRLVYNYKEAYDSEKLAQRFSDILTKYDYILGDWGHEQLRLKGFYSSSRKKIPDEQKILAAQDYLDEYCNYGCAFFIIKRLRAKEKNKSDRPLYTERQIRQGEKSAKPSLDKTELKLNLGQDKASIIKNRDQDKPSKNSSTGKKKNNFKPAHVQERKFKVSDKKHEPSRSKISSDRPTRQNKGRKQTFTIIQKDEEESK